jgi:hypothetical protein
MKKRQESMKGWSRGGRYEKGRGDKRLQANRN